MFQNPRPDHQFLNANHVCIAFLCLFLLLKIVLGIPSDCDDCQTERGALCSVCATGFFLTVIGDCSLAIPHCPTGQLITRQATTSKIVLCDGLFFFSVLQDISIQHLYLRMRFSISCCYWLHVVFTSIV